MTENSIPSIVWFISGDLVFASRVRAACEAAGHVFRSTMTVPQPTSDGPIAWVILDLSSRSGVTADLMPACAAVCPDARVIAYGPHVQVPRLRAAREAGIPTVLTRGQFDAALPGLFGDF